MYHCHVEAHVRIIHSIVISFVAGHIHSKVKTSYCLGHLNSYLPSEFQKKQAMLLTYLSGFLENVSNNINFIMDHLVIETQLFVGMYVFCICMVIMVVTPCYIAIGDC